MTAVFGLDATEVVPTDDVDGLLEAVQRELGEMEERLRTAEAAAEVAETASGALSASDRVLQQRAAAFIQTVFDELTATTQRDLDGELAAAHTDAAARIDAARREASRMLEEAQHAIGEAARRTAQTYRPSELPPSGPSDAPAPAPAVTAAANPAPPAELVAAPPVLPVEPPVEAPVQLAEQPEHVDFQPPSPLAELVAAYAAALAPEAEPELAPSELTRSTNGRTLPPPPLATLTEPAADHADPVVPAADHDVEAFFSAEPAAAAIEIPERRKRKRGAAVLELAMAAVLLVILVVVLLAAIG